MLLLAPAQDYASPATLARLEHEYSLAGELDPRWAARPVTLGRHEGRTVLALEDPGGEPRSRLLGKPMELGCQRSSNNPHPWSLKIPHPPD